MSEVRFVTGDTDADLAERLDEEISAFNAAATGHHDGRLLSVAVRGMMVTCARGSTGRRGAGAATSTCSGSGTTSAVMAWEPGCWPPPKPRSGAAAATGPDAAPAYSTRLPSS